MVVAVVEVEGACEAAAGASAALIRFSAHSAFGARGTVEGACMAAGALAAGVAAAEAGPGSCPDVVWLDVVDRPPASAAVVPVAGPASCPSRRRLDVEVVSPQAFAGAGPGSCPGLVG